MTRTIFIIAVLILNTAAMGQKIETQKPDQGQIIRVQTALNHLTVIQLSEPVVSVATGSQVFKVEWRENKVFVQPTEPNVSTNLFIWTRSGRQNYELEPAGPVEKMDFAIDHPAIEPPQPVTSSDPPVNQVKPLTGAMMVGKPVKLQTWKSDRWRVQIMFRDCFEENGLLYIRYEVQNGSKKTYVPGTPRVFEIRTSKLPKVSAGLANTQLSEQSVRKLRLNAQLPVEVITNELRASGIESGEETTGVVCVKLHTPESRPQVLRLYLANDAIGPVTATLVL